MTDTDRTLADLVRAAARTGRRAAAVFPASVKRDALPWAVIEAFDADVRGHVERDPRIEDERDRVLVAAVTLAEIPAGCETEAEEVAAARRRLAAAIDYLEETVLRFGRVNRVAARRGYGRAGEAVSDPAARD